MSKVIPLILLSTGCFLLCLLYLNRSSSRIHEATTVIAIVIIGTLVFVMKGESFEKNISTAYFVDHKNKTPLFFRDMPVLFKYYMHRNVILTKHRDKLSGDEKERLFDRRSQGKTFLDLQTISVLQFLNMFYNRYWYIEKVSEITAGGGTSIAWSPKEKENVGNDLVRYNKDTLPDSLKHNMFFDDLDPYGSDILTLPKGTKISYTPQDEKQGFCEYRFYKPRNFDIRIKISSSSYVIGLGDFAHYVGLPDTYETLTFTGDKFKDYVEALSNYGSFTLQMNCKASFHWLRAWNPSVIRYKKWARNLFGELYDAYDWSVCRSKIKDYQLDLASRKIIDHNKPTE